MRADDPLVGVGVLLAVAVRVVSGLGGENSATVLEGGWTTAVVGPALVVAGADVVRGSRFGGPGMVVVTGAGAVVCTATDGGVGGSVVVTGELGTVDVAVGSCVTTGAGVVAD